MVPIRTVGLADSSALDLPFVVQVMMPAMSAMATMMTPMTTPLDGRLLGLSGSGWAVVMVMLLK